MSCFSNSTGEIPEELLSYETQSPTGWGPVENVASNPWLGGYIQSYPKEYLDGPNDDSKWVDGDIYIYVHSRQWYEDWGGSSPSGSGYEAGYPAFNADPNTSGYLTPGQHTWSHSGTYLETSWYCLRRLKPQPEKRRYYYIHPDTGTRYESAWVSDWSPIPVVTGTWCVSCNNVTGEIPSELMSGYEERSNSSERRYYFDHQIDGTRYYSEWVTDWLTIPVVIGTYCGNGFYISGLAIDGSTWSLGENAILDSLMVAKGFDGDGGVVVLTSVTAVSNCTVHQNSGTLAQTSTYSIKPAVTTKMCVFTYTLTSSINGAKTGTAVIQNLPDQHGLLVRNAAGLTTFDSNSIGAFVLSMIEVTPTQSGVFTANNTGENIDGYGLEIFPMQWQSPSVGMEPNFVSHSFVVEYLTAGGAIYSAPAQDRYPRLTYNTDFNSLAYVGNTTHNSIIYVFARAV